MKKEIVDEYKTTLLNEFYYELNFDHRTKLYVIKGNIFNAFALPDNSIFVFENVLENIESYPELAALLAHEYAHIQQRHGMKSLANAITWELAGTLITFGNNAEDFIRNANLLLGLSYSREFETQADLKGLYLLEKNSIDTRGMIDLFNRMLKMEGVKKDRNSIYLSTHPDTEDRLKEVIHLIKQQKNQYKINETLDSLFINLKAPKTKLKPKNTLPTDHIIDEFSDSVAPLVDESVAPIVDESVEVIGF